MSTEELIKKLAQLPEQKQQSVKDFIAFRLYQMKEDEAKKEVRKSGFGALKGTIKMADDFDEPLEDLKDYM